MQTTRKDCKRFKTIEVSRWTDKTVGRDYIQVTFENFSAEGGIDTCLILGLNDAKILAETILEQLDANNT